MATFEQVRDILVSSLGLGKRGPRLQPSTPLLGEIPEFDSMAVINVVSAIEEQFDIMFDDDEINGEVFETVGSLCTFVESKLSA